MARQSVYTPVAQRMLLALVLDITDLPSPGRPLLEYSLLEYYSVPVLGSVTTVFLYVRARALSGCVRV